MSKQAKREAKQNKTNDLYKAIEHIKNFEVERYRAKGKKIIRLGEKKITISDDTHPCPWWRPRK
jgi:hypothetical protein